MTHGYLVAQINDVVEILEPGPLLGTYGKVLEERTDTRTPSVTARRCRVRFDGGVAWVHADYLKVVPDYLLRASPNQRKVAPN